MSSGKELNPKQKRNKIALILVFVLLILAVYSGGIVYAMQRFLPNTSIKGMDVSGMSSEEANQLLKNQKLVIEVDQKARNGKDIVTETLDLERLTGASVEYATAEVISSQDRFLWFKSFFVPTDFTEVKGNGTFDDSILKRAVGRLCSQQKSTAIEPKDAYIRIEGKDISIVPEVEGNAVERSVALEKILAAAEAIMSGEGSQKVDLTELCKKPLVKSTDAELIAKRTFIEKIAGRTINIEYTSSYSDVLEGEDILNLLELDGSEIGVNGEKLQEYVGYMADVYYVNRYEYLIYDDLYTKLSAALLSEKDEYIEASWYINYPTPRTNGNGSPSFVEVSIGYQYLWYYENGVTILSTPIVTGKQGEFDTPTGYFTVTEKSTKTRLVGKDYDTTVNYWMGIDNIGYYGLHDATWRGSFGGDIYKYDGSHGCINLPYGIAEALYARVQAGVTEVYIYN